MDIYDILLEKKKLRREKDKFIKEKNKNKLNVIKIIENIKIESNKKIKYLHNCNINSNENIINIIKEKYYNELKYYIYINSYEINKIKLGGFIRYFDLNNNIKWGGIVVKLININKLDKFIIMLKNSNNNIWKINFLKYYIFFKDINFKNDVFKDIFINKIK